MKKVAVITTIMAMYRYEIASLLSCQKDPTYRFYTSKKSHSGIKPVDASKSFIQPEDGGIKWSFVKNIYIKGICIWQNGVFKIGVSRKYSTLILLGNMYCLSTWVNAILGRIAGKHIIMWTHGLKGGDFRLQLFFRLMFYRLAHDLFVYEKRGKNLLINEGFNKDNVHVIYNSLAYKTHLKLRSELTEENFDKTKKKLFNNDYPTLVYSGRLVKSKKVHLLLESLSLFEDDNINCLIIGDGDQRKFLEDLVQEKGIKNVVFYGGCYDESKLSKLIGMSDVMVSPGNIGLAVVHAFSFGTPVISHNNMVTQMPEVEIIDQGVNGLLFDENNIEDLKTKIVQWISQNSANRAAIRKQCYLKVDQYYNPNYQVKVFNKIVQRGINQNHS